MSIAASVGVFFIAVLTPSVAPVEPGPTVYWDAPAGCGSADALRERLTDSLGPLDLESSIEIVGRVRAQQGLYALELELAEPSRGSHPVRGLLVGRPSARRGLTMDRGG
ncbi:MAG: hypothetical protein AAGF11_13395 [Myxococcota bacterium]